MNELLPPPTLVLPPRLNEDCRAARDAAVREGWDIFQASGWQIPPGLSVNEPVIYSEPLFADVAAAELDLSLLDPPADWLVSVPSEYVRRHIRFAPLWEVRTVSGGPWFLKPAEDKSFPARVYDSASELPGDDQLPGSMPVLLSEPVHWLLEVRCFVLDRQVIALSPYFRSGELAEGWKFSGEEEKQALAFARQLLSDNRLSFPPAVVLDIGRIENRGWAVVETNPAWGSGIYGCDPKRILPVLRRATVLEGHPLTDDEKQFIRPRIQIER